MSWTKRQFINGALDELGLNYGISGLDLEKARMRLDAMVATWNAKGIRISFPLPSSPEDSDLDEESNVPDSANQAIILNLAVQLAPAYGKTAMPDTKMSAKDAYDGLLILSTRPGEIQFPGNLPLGAGNKVQKGTSGTFVADPVDDIEAGGDSELTFE